MLRLREDLSRLNYDHRGDIKIDEVYRILLRIRERISILHFSGHADSLHIHLENGEYNIANLSQLLQDAPKLKLVVLNGCSTKGMVDAFLAVGVKAVIATSVEVQDKAAAIFSEAFYESFSNGNTLQRAFLDALSHGDLPPPPGIEDTIVTRATFERKHKTKKAPDPIPWGLYYREDQKAILNWKLVQPEDSTNNVEPSNPEVEALRQRVKEYKKELDEVLLDIEDLEIDLAEMAADHNRRPRKERSLQRKRDELEEIEQDIDQCYQQIVTINRQQDQLDVAESLRLAIDRLNYWPQRQRFRRIYEQQAASGTLRGAFIVQGSPMCGQEMLKERLTNLGGVRNEFKEIKIDFEALSLAAVNPENIWERFQHALYELIEKPLPTPADIDPLGIVTEVYNNFFAKTYPQHLIILFNNIHTFTEKLNLQLVREFWFVFSDHLDTLLDGKKMRSKLLLFIIDRDCELLLEDGVASSDKDSAFQSAFGPQALKKYQTYLFPIISPLLKEDLERWYGDSNLPLDLGLSTELFDSITGDKGNYMLPSIKKLCEETGNQDIYNQFYRDYEFQIPKL